MRTPNYLDEKENIMIFQNGDISNPSKLNLDDKNIYFKKSKTVFLYFEDFDYKHLKINLDKNVDIKLYIILKSSKSTEYNIDFNLEEKSKLTVFFIIRNVELVDILINYSFNLSKTAKVFIKQALLARGHITLNNDIYLNDEFAEVDIDLLNIGSYNDIFDIKQNVIHNAKSTISKINNSLISHSNSKLYYSVSGRIYKGNEFSSCKQNNKGIILDEFGIIKVEPKLYIDEYNVDASHGAAIGQIDDEQMYYLLSRGLTEHEAKNLIISGYTKPFINNIEDEDIRLLVERQILKRIKEESIV